MQLLRFICQIPISCFPFVNLFFFSEIGTYTNGLLVFLSFERDRKRARTIQPLNKIAIIKNAIIRNDSNPGNTVAPRAIIRTLNELFRPYNH